MMPKAFFQVAGAIFGLIALLHLARLVWGWPAQIGGWSVPLWLSWLALLVGGYLAYQAFKLNKV